MELLSVIYRIVFSKTQFQLILLSKTQQWTAVVHSISLMQCIQATYIQVTLWCPLGRAVPKIIPGFNIGCVMRTTLYWSDTHCQTLFYTACNKFGGNIIWFSNNLKYLFRSQIFGWYGTTFWNNNTFEAMLQIIMHVYGRNVSMDFFWNTTAIVLYTLQR